MSQLSQTDRARHNLSALRKAIDKLERMAVSRLSPDKAKPFYGRLELTIFVREDVITGCETNSRDTEQFLTS